MPLSAAEKKRRCRPKRDNDAQRLAASYIEKQEAQGPHCSHAKAIQINKHIQLY